MRFARTEESETTIINMSSLLDVLFILIIFFLATATFRQEEFDHKVNLPQASTNRALSATPKAIVINVRSNGRYVLANDALVLADLRKAVAAAVQKNPAQKVLIRGDRKALHGHVAAAVAACRQAGVQEAHIGYEWKVKG